MLFLPTFVFVCVHLQSLEVKYLTLNSLDEVLVLFADQEKHEEEEEEEDDDEEDNEGVDDDEEDSHFGKRTQE